MLRYIILYYIILYYISPGQFRSTGDVDTGLFPAKAPSRDRDRETERQRDRETERQRDRGMKGWRDLNIYIYIYIYKSR